MSTTGIDTHSHNLAFVEALYADYLRDPHSVDARWRATFDALPSARDPASGLHLGPRFQPRSIFNPPGGNGSASGNGHAASEQVALIEARQDRVDQMVRNFRVRGHMMARLDPLGLPRAEPRELDPEFYGFSAADLDQPFSSRTIKGPDVRTLGEILQRLRDTYCRYIGVQYMHIDEYEVRHWLQERMEGSANRCKLTRTEQFRILTRLTDAVIFEEFIQKKFTGAKSFSLEGAESLIPLLDLALEHAGGQGVEEVVLGMAHRGRLNVLANILGKSPQRIFAEFRDLDGEKKIGRGDVKYHLGWSGEWTTAAGQKLYLALCFNPSHLEFVNPVAMGRLRAKRDRVEDRDHRKGLLILIHGDAAFAGEGIVQETLQLSQLGPYTVGGALHVIVNNQIGFTTSPEQARSSIYCSSIGKMLQVPIFLVNGEDPESVAQCVRLALDFRQRFQRDVIIDLWCYRRRGHNETDEPAFTQPTMYRAIRQRPTVRQSYLKRLIKMGDVTQEAGDEIRDSLTRDLEQQLSAVEQQEPPAPPRSVLASIWSRYRGGPDRDTPEIDTGMPLEQLAVLLRATAEVPADFHVHPKLLKVLEARRNMAQGAAPLDWAAGEAAAFASLAAAGTRVRLTGQDSERGTFSHRHTVLHDHETGRTHCPLQHVAAGQAPVEIYNSALSEAGVLGFEYGYSIAYPDALVLWEAQFGDFVNVAQVIIDQFITSAEEKWFSLSGLVLLLPHGMEGQGPEHSSARIERFLQLAAEDNIQVAWPTTPAQMFHLLRRQVLRPWRKPLIVMTPKSLLRHPQAVSPLEEFTRGRFQRVIADETVDPRNVGKLLLCSGKVYYELEAERQRSARRDVAIVRIEQLYPLSDETLQSALQAYPRGIPAVYVQEEPENMGAWPYLRLRFGDTLLGRWPLSHVSRRASASPATGSPAAHKLEQRWLMEQAFGKAD